MLLTSLNLIFWIHVPSLNHLQSCLTLDTSIGHTCLYASSSPSFIRILAYLLFEVDSMFLFLIKLLYRLGTKPPFSLTVLECFLASRSRGEYGASRNPSSPNLKTAFVQIFLDIEHLSYCSWSSSSFTSPAWNLSKRSWSLLGFETERKLWVHQS